MTRRDERKAPADDASLENLSGAAQTVLAVATLAALWREEFSTNRVSMTDVVRYARVGYTDLSPATRQLFQRARDQFAERLPEVHQEVAPEGAVVWLDNVPAGIEDWLYARGQGLIQSAHWSRFVAGRIRPPDSVEAALRGIDETAARILIVQGRKQEALDVLESALTKPLPINERAGLLLARTFALLRTGDLDGYKRACGELAELAPKLPRGDVADRLLKARIQVEFAYSQFLSGILDPHESVGIASRLQRCRDLLQEARTFEAGLSPMDQARLTNVEALLDKAEARVARGANRERLFDQADHGFRRAFALARTVWDTYGMGAALYNLGELHYVRFRLDKLGASEEQILTALQWYRGSIALAESLRTNRDLVLDYARVADVLGVLIATGARSADAHELLLEAERHLTYARLNGSAVEQRLVEWVDRRLTEHVAIAGLSRAAAP